MEWEVVGARPPASGGVHQDCHPRVLSPGGALPAQDGSRGVHHGPVQPPQRPRAPRNDLFT